MTLSIKDGNWGDLKKESIEKEIDRVIQEATAGNQQAFGQRGDELHDIIYTAVMNSNRLPSFQKEEIAASLIAESEGYGPLKLFFKDGIMGPDGWRNARDITEVMVNPNPMGRPRVFYGYQGRPWYAGDHFFPDDRAVKNYVQKICEDARRQFNEDNSIVDAWLSDGSRLAAFGFRVCPTGTAFTIRKSPSSRPPMPMSELVRSGMLPILVADLTLEAVVRGDASFGICGRTDSGKTTYMRACGEAFKKEERVMIGETSYELAFPHLPNSLNLVEVTVASQKIISMGAICESFLRNNPDRPIVSEIRGGEIVSASEIAEAIGKFIASLHAGGILELANRFPKMFGRGGMTLYRDHVMDQMGSMFHFLYFFDKPDSGQRTLMSMHEYMPKIKEYRPIVEFDKAEYWSSHNVTRRWIYKNPISEERISDLGFRGANIKDEFCTVKEKYLYPEAM